MTSPSHSGPPPARPELPDGVPPPAGPPPRMAPSGPATPGRAGWPEFTWWGPVLALLSAFLLALFAFAIIAGVADAVGGGVELDEPPPGVTIGATLVQNAALVVFAVLFAAIGGRRPTREDFGLRRVSFWSGLGWAAASLGAFYLFSFVWAIALNVDEQDDLAQQLGAGDSTLNLVAVALLVAVAAPIGEEFFFRGYFFPALGRRLGLIPAALAVGIVFGTIHAGGTSAVFLVPLAVFGFLLCLLFHRTGSLLPCMGLHALNNAVALGVTLDWAAWQVMLGAVVAPALTLALVVPVARTAPRPAYG